MATAMNFEEMDLENLDVPDWRKNVQRCGKCRRMKYGHPQPFGAEKCELERIDDEKELEEDDEKKRQMKNEKEKNLTK